MAVIAEVIARGYYTRSNNAVQELPIGKQIIVKAIPEALKFKLKKVKEVDDGQLIVNDDPEAAKLREEGKDASADKLMSDQKAKKKPGRAAKAS